MTDGDVTNMAGPDRAAHNREAEWDALRATYLLDRDDRPPSAARGVHHVALVSSDVEQTIRFYQEVLEFPLTELFENRDYDGSTHFFFDIGHENALAFFDFPGLDVGGYAEVLGDSITSRSPSNLSSGPASRKSSMTSVSSTPMSTKPRSTSGAPMVSVSN